MLFGTCYDVYVHRPMEKSIRAQRQRTNSDAAPPFAIEPRSRLVLVLRMFSVVFVEAFFLLFFYYFLARNLEYILDTRMEEGQIRCLHGSVEKHWKYIVYIKVPDFWACVGSSLVIRFAFGTIECLCWLHSLQYYYICTSLTTGKLLKKVLKRVLQTICSKHCMNSQSTSTTN